MSAPGGAINTAIASGAAFGHAGGGSAGADIGAGDSKLTALGEIGIAGAAGFLGEKMSSLFTDSPNLGLKAIFGGGNMTLLGKGKFFGIFSSIFTEGEGGDASGGGSAASSSSGGGSDSAAYSAMSGAMMPYGVTGGEPVPHDRLGQLFPDPTPSRGGREQELAY